jgi:hypothetical protein
MGWLAVGRHLIATQVWASRAGSLYPDFHRVILRKGTEMSVSERSFARIVDADLRHMSGLVLGRLSEIFSYAPVAGLYRDRLVALVLCQGAAAHFVDGTTGINDLDVWAFFSDGPEKPFPWRVIWRADFGPSRLGRHPDDVGY